MNASPTILTASRPPLWTAYIFAAYVVAVALLSGQHELWRDEVRALSLARSADNPLDLVQNRLVDEGHPAVWYLLLWTAWRIAESTIVLKVVAVLAAVIFSGLFFFCSPFPLPHRILFLLGILPLHLYSVMARNYGISAVFLFWIAWEHGRPRESSPWIVGLCNALLANTNVYGAFCAIGLMLLPWKLAQSSWQRQLRARLIVVALTAIGGLVLAYTVWPTQGNLVTREHKIGSSGIPGVDSSKVARAFWSTCTDEGHWTTYMLTGFDPTKRLTKMGGNAWWQPFDVMGLVLIVLLLRTPVLRVAFLTTFLLAGVFSRLVYPADERHLGVLTMFLLSLFWIHAAWEGPAHPRNWRCILIGLFLVLLAHAVMGGYTTYVRLRYPYSQSKYAGQFLAAGDAGTIVICEPDDYGDALPYYASNDIFIVREKGFHRYVSYTAPYNYSLTLGDIMTAAEQLQKDTGRRVLVALPMPITQLQEGQYEGRFNRNLKVIMDEVRKFQQRYTEVAAFDGQGQETYVFYAFGN